MILDVNGILKIVLSKQINIKKPQNSGSMYYNYKGTFTIVLIAIVNAN